MSHTAESPRRYAIIGTGSRSEMYVRALLGSHSDVGTPVAWVDSNPVRMAYYDRLFGQFRPGAALPSSYAPTELERMRDETGADAVVITTPDFTHHEYVMAALKLGMDVVVEKPLTVNAQNAAAIAEAAAASSANVTVTFNYRYSPRNTLVRQLIDAGEIGSVTSVHFEWLLDTGHGADYFRRWHREKEKSGGLLVHKATHHFDLVNWWTSGVPETVFAVGGLRFYGEGNAGASSPGARDGRFDLDLGNDPRMRQLFKDAEHVDGYRRNQDVFAPGVTIEDNMSVLVGYRSGASLAYTLHAHAPWEGYRVAINGTRGRLELDVVEKPHRARGADQTVDPSAQDDGTADGAARDSLRPRSSRLLLQKHFERPVEIPIPEGVGGHGGGDLKLLDDVFRGGVTPGTHGSLAGEEKLSRRAGYLDGLRSIAVGIAANASIATGEVTRISELGFPIDQPALHDS